MLNEELRVLAGLQESLIKEDTLKTFLIEEETSRLKEKQRKMDEHKTVASNFDIFQQKIEQYKETIALVYTLFNSNNSKEFVNGLFEQKYTYLQRFADIVINESFSTSISYLEQHYYSIKEELNIINHLSEELDESNAETYFVSNKIVSTDTTHNITFRLFKNKNLTEAISNEILYGSQISLISDNFVIVKESGKKRYALLTRTHIKTLLDSGYLI